MKRLHRKRLQVQRTVFSAFRSTTAVICDVIAELARFCYATELCFELLVLLFLVTFKDVLIGMDCVVHVVRLNF